MDQVRRAYDTLGLSAGAGPAEVRRAYRNLVRRWHPDRFTNEPLRQHRALEMLKGINEAYELVLAEISNRPDDSEASLWAYTAPTVVPPPVPEAAQEPPPASETPASFLPDILLGAVRAFSPSWRKLLLSVVVIAAISAAFVLLDRIAYRKNLEEAAQYDSSRSSDAVSGTTHYGAALPAGRSGDGLSGRSATSPTGPTPPRSPYVQAPDAPIVPEAPAAPAAPIAAPAR